MTGRQSVVASALAAALGAAAGGAVRAQASPATEPLVAGTGRPLWELGLGVGGLRLPHYRGADQSHNWLLPVPYLVYRGEILKADRDGARAVLVDPERFDFDLSLAASAPTRSEDNDARRGMADLQPTVELGPNLNWRLARGPGWKLELRLPRGAVTVERSPRWIGLTAQPQLNLDTRVQGWNLGLQGGALWGSRRYHAIYYDVAASEALPDRPAYRAGAGYGGLQFTAALSRRVGEAWVGAFVRHDRLDGAAFADSPLVRDRHTWSAGLAVAWVFARSDRRVPAAD